MLTKIFFALLIVTLAAALACDVPALVSAPAASPTEPPTAIPQATATIRPTATPKPTPNVRVTLDALEATIPAVRATPTPTPTPVPTPTHTPVPTATPALAAAFRNTVTENANTIYLIDTSPSFEAEFNRVKAHLKTVIEAKYYSTNTVQLMTFDNVIDIKMPFRSMDSNDAINAFEEAVDSMRSVENTEFARTVAYEAIEKAHEALQRFARDDDKPNVIVIFTDGAASDFDRSNVLFDDIRNSNVPNLRIDVIGYGVVDLWDCSNAVFPPEIDLDLVTERQGVGDNASRKWVNQKLQELYGYTVAELSEKHCLRIIDPMIDMARITDGTYDEVSRSEY